MIEGWSAGAPDEAPVMPVTSMLLDVRQQEERPFAVVEAALARSRAQEAREAREAAAAAVDPDERAANMLAMGYRPGEPMRLQHRLAGVEADLAAERGKIERGVKLQKRIHRDHEAGRITAWDIMAMPGIDEGDPGRVEMLERRAESLRGQIRDMTAVMSAGREPAGTASRGGHDLFVLTTRSMMDGAGRRPFGRSGGVAGDPVRPDVAVRSETCVYCIAGNVSEQDSFLLHSDPELNVPVTSPEQAAQAEAGRSSGRVPMIYR